MYSDKKKNYKVLVVPISDQIDTIDNFRKKKIDVRKQLS